MIVKTSIYAKTNANEKHIFDEMFGYMDVFISVKSSI